MKSRNILVSVMSLACMLLFTACSSSVKRADGFLNYKYMGQKFNKINISLSSEAQDKYAGKTLFNPGRLSWAIKRQIKDKGLFSEISEDLIEIVVTDIRTRSSFSADMFGVMAGADRLEGDVFIKDAEGKVLNSFRISASYALGGRYGGNDDIRMEWLYGKFAQITVQNILGKKAD